MKRPCPECGGYAQHHPLCPNHPDDEQGEALGSFATVCPECGAQVMDPFTGTRVIHDVAACCRMKAEGAG